MFWIFSLHDVQLFGLYSSSIWSLQIEYKERTVRVNKQASKAKLKLAQEQHIP